ncbi:nitronate monooxygenase [Spiractinospora alimapuensis]|nr:nitronate monooxygenase [Spiractinospora alimapuensis]
MAGGVGTPEFVVAVDTAGGLGSLAGGYLPTARLEEQIATVRAAGVVDFGVNLFVPGPPGDEDAVRRYRRELGPGAGEPVHDDDGWREKIDLTIRLAVPLVSFTFGCPDAETLRRFHAAGVLTMVSVTRTEEARQAVDRGAGGVCAQGLEAGGHRATFDPEADPGYPVRDLVSALVDAVDVPVVAAGGVTEGRDAATLTARGAAGVQVGTAFLRCPESGAHPAHKSALGDPGFTTTALTRAFTGRLARGLENRFMGEHPAAPAAYPEVHHMTRPLRAEAAAVGDTGGMALWAGEGFTGAAAVPAEQVVSRLRSQAAERGVRL